MPALAGNDSGGGPTAEPVVRLQCPEKWVREEVSAMLRFFAQAQYTADCDLCGFELFLKEETPDYWRVPEDFNAIPVSLVESLLMSSLAVLPQKPLVVSVNLDQTQFIQPEFVAMMGRVRPHFPFYDLFVELTEYDQAVTPEQLRCAAAAFLDVDVHVCLDDVGWGANNDELSRYLDPYVGEYKFALQNYRGEAERTVQSAPAMALWTQRAKDRYKRITIEGIEDADTHSKVRAYEPDMLQGYYFGKPEMIPVEEPVAK